MRAVLLRMKNILFHPAHEWQVIKDEPTTVKQLIVGYVAVLAAVPLVVSILEAIVFRSGAAGNFRLATVGPLFAGYVLWYVMIVVDVIILAAIIKAFVIPGGPLQNGRQGLKLAAYSATPLFPIGIVMSLPRLEWLEYIEILYSIYLLYLGIGSLMNIRPGKAVWYAVASFSAAGVIVGVLNMFEYLFESYLARAFILPG